MIKDEQDSVGKIGLNMYGSWVCTADSKSRRVSQSEGNKDRRCNSAKATRDDRYASIRQRTRSLDAKAMRGFITRDHGIIGKLRAAPVLLRVKTEGMEFRR